jgi:hypothetical protein
MKKPKMAAEELAEMIRDGLAEEGFEIRVHSNSQTGWDVAISSDKDTADAQSRADAIAVELRQCFDLRG